MALSWRLSSFLVLLLWFVVSCEEHGLLYPSSCRDLADGETTLKLMDGGLEDAPLVDLACSHGYTILDVSKDGNLESYFDTFKKYHHSAAGPTNDVHTNWEGWYKPDDGSTQYLISPDCNTCEAKHRRQLYSTTTTSQTTNEDGETVESTQKLHKTAYMMTGTLFGCFWNLKGEHNFDHDYNSYQCYWTSGAVNDVGESIRNELTDDSHSWEWDSSGVCSFSVRASNRELPDPMSHDACTVDLDSLGADASSSYHLKPSLGTDGEFCVCVKPARTEFYSVSADAAQAHLDAKEVEKLETVKVADEAENSVEDEYELYQKDFERGTYRILKSGTYKVMEDIVFDFNANEEAPNDENAWWPQPEQEETYPGAGGFSDAYFMGFFAGISIEANDVVLDLNGHELKMSDHFYVQQRWFTSIALQSQYFLPGQGIGFFGAEPKFSENVVIKDGVLGLTSHHGIHGHFNKNVRIENLQIKEFETHGIQFNGFDGVTIINCEIGPTAQSKSWLKGEYGHARVLLPRLQMVAEGENGDEKMKFYGRDEEVTMSDIVDELRKQTDMAYYYVTEGREYDEDDESWISAKELFIDNTGYPNGAAMYGIFLNTYGASVLTYNLYTSSYSSDATVENVLIHGLRHSMTEYIRMSVPSSGNLYMNALHAPLDATQVLESVTDFSAPRYKGSILTDATLALQRLSSDWNLLQAQLVIESKMLDWAFGDNLDGMDDVQIGCNIDVMIHSGKGINALRIDGVDGVTLTNVEIRDVQDLTPLGREECGEYQGFRGTGCTGACGGHFRQTQPMQIGFSGNMAQGVNVNAARNVVLKDIKVSDISSQTGHAYGVSIWPGVDVELQGSLEAKFVRAGTELELGSLNKRSRPNLLPEACGVRVYEEYETNGFTYEATVNADAAEIEVNCVEGHVGCLGVDGVVSNIGDTADTADTADETCDPSEVSVDLKNLGNEKLAGVAGIAGAGMNGMERNREERVYVENADYSEYSENAENIGSGDGGDSTKTSNDSEDKMFGRVMMYLMGFLVISMIAGIGGKFVQQWLPVVDYLVEKRRAQSRRLNTQQYVRYTQVEVVQDDADEYQII